MLTVKREKFAKARAAGMHQTDAYREAFSTKKMKPETIWSEASRIDADPLVTARVAELKAAIDAADVFSIANIRALVLQDAADVLAADPSELITHRRLNCRHCHGTNHAYRWRDDVEFWNALAKASEAQEAWDGAAGGRKRGKRPELPTDEGGYGFKRLAPPSPDCPQCEGEGLEDVRVADIRTLSGPARRMYNGIQVTKDGMKVMMRDKDSARALLAQHAGLISNKVQLGGLVGLTPVMPEQLSESEKAMLDRALENDV